MGGTQPPDPFLGGEEGQEKGGTQGGNGQQKEDEEARGLGSQDSMEEKAQRDTQDKHKDLKEEIEFVMAKWAAHQRWTPTEEEEAWKKVGALCIPGAAEYYAQVQEKERLHREHQDTIAERNERIKEMEEAKEEYQEKRAAMLSAE
ncbi:hypothetical protein GGI23_001690, partial [Coemansia sp. RSA 2559]